MLAFACAFTMFAGAAFTDSADISQTEAVDMLTALGVIDGYEDGSFRPDDTVTRAEAAKMIYTIRNGGNTNADAFAGGVTSFTDVYAGYWAEGYIKYCQAMGIISGKSTTSFDPEGTVTGTELAKMLLVTLGYDAEVAGLEGAGWDQKTIGLASENGLLEDVTASLSGACPRQFAAQIMYNAIGADIVVLKDGKYQKVEITTSKIVGYDSDKDGNEDFWVAQNVTTNKTLGKEYMDLNEDEMRLDSISQNDKGEYSLNGTLFTKITEDYSDLMGQNVKVLYKDTDDVYGVYADADSKVVAAATVGEMEAVTSDSSKIKVNGTEYKIDGTTATDLAYNFNSSTGASSLTDVLSGAKANTVKLIDNDDNGKIDRAIVVPTVVAKVTYVGTDSLTLDNSIGNKDLEDVVAYDGVAKDDYVLYVADTYTADDDIHLTKIDIVSGTVTSTRGSTVSEAYVDGTWYKVDANATGDDINAGDSYDFVIVGNYIYNAELTDSTSVANILYVEKCDPAQDSGLNAGTQKIKARFSDNSTEEITLVEKYKGTEYEDMNSTDNKVEAGEIYTYSKTSDGYRVKAIDATKYDGNNLTSAADGTAISIKDGIVTDGTDTTYVKDSSVFFVKAGDKYAALTGTQVKAWGDTEYKTNVTTGTALTSNVYSKLSGNTSYVEVAAVELATVTEIPGAAGDKAYGMIMTTPATGKNADGDDVVTADVYTDSGLIEDAILDGAAEDDYAKGDVISCNIDGNKLKDLAKPFTATAIQADRGNGNLTLWKAVSSKTDVKVVDDTKTIYVNTSNWEGTNGSGYPEVDREANGDVIANAYVALDGSTNEIAAIIIDVNGKLHDSADAEIVAVAGTAYTITNSASSVSATGTDTSAAFKVEVATDSKASENVTVKVTPTTAVAAGNKATVTVAVKTTDDSAEVKTVTLDFVASVTEAQTFTFNMPAEGVTITATAVTAAVA